MKECLSEYEHLRLREQTHMWELTWQPAAVAKPETDATTGSLEVRICSDKSTVTFGQINSYIRVSCQVLDAHAKAHGSGRTVWVTCTLSMSLLHRLKMLAVHPVVSCVSCSSLRLCPLLNTCRQVRENSEICALVLAAQNNERTQRGVDDTWMPRC